MAVVVLMGGIIMVGCQSNTAPIPLEEEMEMVEEVSWMDAVNDYLVDSIGSHYLQGEVCIPYPFIVNVNEDNPEDVLVWGDFWLFHYNLEGETLQMISGGNHAGLMHLRKTAEGYEVTQFDAVEDGSSLEPSARRIFGEYYDLYHDINSNQEVREKTRAEMTAQYVRSHNLKATRYQDYGWPAVELPL